MSLFFHDMFINAAIIIAFISFGNQVFKDKEINAKSPLHQQIVTGVICGVLGCILMIYSVKITPQIIMDLRHIPIVIMALYVSMAAAVSSSVVIGAFRLLYFGMNKASVVAFIVALILGWTLGWIGRLKCTKKVKWAYAILLINVMASLAFYVLMQPSLLLAKVIVVYIVAKVCMAIAVYNLMSYIVRSNTVYRQMKVHADRDFLTGLNNVRKFEQILETAIAKCRERKEYVSVLYIDIDHFKEVNDLYGHAAGDMVLKQLGDVITGTCRSFDAVSRNGGEEFSVILFGCPLDKAMEVAYRIRKKMEEHEFVIDQVQKHRITVSIGVSSFPETTDDPEALVKQADMALYKAKRLGRNRVERTEALEF